MFQPSPHLMARRNPTALTSLSETTSFNPRLTSWQGATSGYARIVVELGSFNPRLTSWQGATADYCRWQRRM